MAKYSDEIRVLDFLCKQKEPLLLKQINIGLSLRFKDRALLAILNSLVENKRIEKYGETNNAKYFIDDILRYYQKYEFLYVHKDCEVAGYFYKLNDRYRFIYATNFLTNLSSEIATIKLTTKYHDYKEIPPVFEENIPEGINREILETNTKESIEFNLLVKLKDNIGDLYFSKSSESIDSELMHGQSYLTLLEDILGTNNKIEVLEDFEIGLEEKHIFPENYDLTKQEIKKSDGISGFQYKKLVNIDFEEKKIVVDSEVSKEYILKPYSKLKANPHNTHYFPHISINEHLFISFAKNELNFRVPYSAILKREEDEEYHYIIKRFDRYGMHRFSKNTFAPFLGLVSDTKYDTTSEKLFKRISKEIINPNERMQLLKHYVYSVIIVHEDMHTKNLSLIMEKDKVLFAPLYDIACTGVYETSKGYESHLTINGKQTNIRPNDFKELCRILNINFIEFKKEASVIADKYIKELPSYFDELEKLGEFPFYKSKIKQKAGEQADWVRTQDNKTFIDALRKFHKERSEKLTEMNWVIKTYKEIQSN